MDSTLQRHCHQLCKLGSAKTITIYFSAANAISAKVDLAASIRFMTMVSVRAKELTVTLTNVLKLRAGNLYTNKLAFRYGHATTAMCPLCK
jgi:hypothetical protein